MRKIAHVIFFTHIFINYEITCVVLDKNNKSLTEKSKLIFQKGQVNINFYLFVRKMIYYTFCLIKVVLIRNLADGQTPLYQEHRIDIIAIGICICM